MQTNLVVKAVKQAAKVHYDLRLSMLASKSQYDYCAAEAVHSDFGSVGYNKSSIRTPMLFCHRGRLSVL